MSLTRLSPSVVFAALSLTVACSSPEPASIAMGLDTGAGSTGSATGGSSSADPSSTASSTNSGTAPTTTATGSNTGGAGTGAGTSGGAADDSATDDGTTDGSASGDDTVTDEDTTDDAPMNGAGLGGGTNPPTDDAAGADPDDAASTVDDSALGDDEPADTTMEPGLPPGGGAGGMAGNTDPMGGAGGMGGMPGAADDGAGEEPGGAGSPAPSPGCGGGPQSGTANIQGGVVTFPSSYDGNTPIPMVFGFHGAGRTNTQFREVDARTQGTAFEQNYVMVYLKSNGNDWTGQLQGNISLFGQAYDQVTNDYCIDQSRVFAIGHSSGAQFISNLLCQDETRLTAVGPVASSRYCENSPTPTFYIQGRMDQERGGGNGQDVVNAFVASNGCSSTSMPYQVEGCSSSGTQVDPGCVQYEGCSEPLFWCSHNDPNYSNTNHGWPCFANTVLFDFFETF